MHVQVCAHCSEYFVVTNIPGCGDLVKQESHHFEFIDALECTSVVLNEHLEQQMRELSSVVESGANSGLFLRFELLQHPLRRARLEIAFEIAMPQLVQNTQYYFHHILLDHDLLLDSLDL